MKAIAAQTIPMGTPGMIADHEATSSVTSSTLNRNWPRSMEANTAEIPVTPATNVEASTATIPSPMLSNGAASFDSLNTDAS